MAVLLDGHTWLWVHTPQCDVSWSHGGKGSPFNVNCHGASVQKCVGLHS